MSRFFLVFLSTIVLVLFTACGTQKINSQWQSQSIEIDGESVDWTDMSMQFNEDLNVMFAIANDDSNLNVMFRFNDPALARMLSLRGFTLWLNDQNKKEKQIGINYVDRSRRENMSNALRPGNRAEMQQKAIIPNGVFSMARDDSATGLPLSDLPGTQAAADRINGLYCFEYKIPLLIVNENLVFEKPQDGRLKLALEISGISEEEKAKMKERMAQRGGKGGSRGGMGGGGRGGMRSGGMGGGRGAGMAGGSRPQMPDMDGKEVWFSVQLATAEK